jgi:ABC-type glycerol-3-phosphate transport system substrate-binding protein
MEKRIWWRQEEPIMKTIAIGLIAAAAALAGCSASSPSPEQAMAPAAGPPLTYPAHNMGEFEAANTDADNYCYKKNDLKRAVYASRTFETASFVCASK